MASMPAHHVRTEECMTRPAYREGRRATAVKVYTIHHESRHLIINGVPEVGGTKELVEQCRQFGTIESHRLLTDYPTEAFTEAYLFSFHRIQSARVAKRKLDDQNFLGGMLHVFYAPEYESVDDVRTKMAERRKAIAFRIRQHEAEQQAEAKLLDTIPTEVTSAVTDNQQASLSIGHPPPFQHSTAVQPSSALPAATWSGTASHYGGLAAAVEAGGRRQVTPSWQDSHSGTLSKPGHAARDASLQPSASLLEQEASFIAYHESLRLPVPALEDSKKVVKKVPQPKSNLPRVRSSHASLPSGYDGRLPGQSRAVNSRQRPPEGDEVVMNTVDSPRNGTSTRPSQNGSASGSQAPRSSETPVPKQFKGSKKLLSMVPRQAVKGQSGDAASRPGSFGGSYNPPVPKDDALSERLRKEALVLTAPQGPVSAEGRDPKTSVATLEEKSVEKTVQMVRKRLSQVISGAVSKKPRTEEQDRKKPVAE